MSKPRPIIFGLNEENMRLLITVIKRKKHKATNVSKALPSYTCFLEDHLEKHRGKKKNKSDFGKDLSNEERIFLICKDSKMFYEEFHNGLCIVERYIDFNSISDYQLDECFDFIHRMWKNSLFLKSGGYVLRKFNPLTLF